MMNQLTAKLFLEDGSVFTGKSFGGTGESIGEIVFNTGMTGYQEILTDPSYYGQFVVMTYPLIGNYGINQEDFESVKPRAFGFVVKEHAEYPSHWRNKKSLEQFLAEHDILGISGIDTRMITKRIREKGTMRAILTTNELTLDEALEKLAVPASIDQVEKVSIKQPFTMPGRGARVVLIDYGYKQGILRELLERHCEVTILPHNYSFSQIMEYNPDGILLSNGPGDPKSVAQAAETLKKLIAEKIPMFGICLGHQLLALASGANTQKMKFGHRGANHPVKDLQTKKIYMTSQNHGYTVTAESLVGCPLKISHTAVNDGTIEGLIHSEAPVFSIQYHPEASPGPNDSSYLFDQFIELIKRSKEIAIGHQDYFPAEMLSKQVGSANEEGNRHA